MTNGSLNNLDEGSAGPELYIIRCKGTVGVTRALRRAAPYMNKVLQCLYLFTNPMDAMKYLDFEVWSQTSGKSAVARNSAE